MTEPTSVIPDGSDIDAALAAQIVDDGVRRYFADRRQRVGLFVDRNL